MVVGNAVEAERQWRQGLDRVGVRVEGTSGTRLKPKGNGDFITHINVEQQTVLSGTRLKPKGNGDSKEPVDGTISMLSSRERG